MDGSMQKRLQQVGQLVERLNNEYPMETQGFLDFLKDAESGAGGVNSTISAMPKETSPEHLLLNFLSIIEGIYAFELTGLRAAR